MTQLKVATFQFSLTKTIWKCWKKNLNWGLNRIRHALKCNFFDNTHNAKIQYWKLWPNLCSKFILFAMKMKFCKKYYKINNKLFLFCHQDRCQSWVKIARGNNLNFWKWQNKVSIWYFVTCLQYQSVQSGFLGLYKSKICYKHLAQLIPPLIHTMKSFWKRMCLSNKNIF